MAPSWIFVFYSSCNLQLVSFNLICQIILVIFQKIRNLIGNEKTREEDMACLVMLYALRYEKHTNNDISGLLQALQRRGVSEKLRKVQ